MRGVNVAAVLVAIGALACGSSGSGPFETTYYPGGDTPLLGGPESDASTMLPPPTPTCPHDDNTDACAAVPGPPDASGADALDAAGEEGDVDGGLEAATDAPSDLDALAPDAGDSIVSDGPDAASPAD
jgi:hypothetical protein